MKTITQLYSFIRKLLTEFVLKWRNYGFFLAWYNLIWWLCFYFRTPFTLKISKWAILKKTKWFDSYFKSKYSDIINETQKYINVPQKELTQYPIWVFWGQGIDKMPPLIKACYKQLTKNNSNITLLTFTNLKDYLSLDKVIYDKVSAGIISWANFSDIIRTTLITKYGGLWIDATVWVNGTIPIDRLMQFELFTPNGKVKQDNRSVQFWTSFEWNWSSWCLCAKHPNSRLFYFISSLLQAIAKRENVWPDYVIQDYLIYFACRNYSDIRKDMEEIKGIAGENRNTFAAIMNNPFNEDEYRKLMSSDLFFKLSFRSSWKEYTNDGKLTFYGYILSDIKQN